MIEEIDNQPRYQKGDLFGAKLFGDYVVGIIRGVDIKRRLPHEIETMKKSSRGVTGLNINEIWYHTDLGGRVKENGILHVGSEAVNFYVKQLQEDLKDARNIIDEIKGCLI